MLYREQFLFYAPSVVLSWFHRKYESGGLNLTAGDFSQLSRPKYLPWINVWLTTMRSCTDVSCTDCFSILSLSVCKLQSIAFPPLTFYMLAQQQYWVSRNFHALTPFPYPVSTNIRLPRGLDHLEDDFRTWPCSA
jgi:hypothetical protein